MTQCPQPCDPDRSCERPGHLLSRPCTSRVPRNPTDGRRRCARVGCGHAGRAPAPLEPLFRQASGLTEDFTSQRARSVLDRLGYTVVNVSNLPRGVQPSPAAAATENATEAGGPEHDNAAADGAGTERVNILRCAIELAASRPEMTADDVVSAADTFARWMNES